MDKIKIISDNPVSPNYKSGNSGMCCAFPLSSKMDNNQVVTVYKSGITKHSADSILLFQCSEDGGISWSAPKNVFDGTGLTPRQTVVTGGIGVNAEGIWVASIGIVEGLDDDTYMFTPEARRKLKRRVLILRSSDRGETWPEREEYTAEGSPGIGIVSPPFCLPSGELALPLERPASDGTHGTAIAFSSDGGRTFSEPVTVAADPSGSLNYTDGRFLVLKNGNILCTLWTFIEDTEETISIHTVLSKDQGRTWSEPVSTGLTGQVTSPIELEGNRLMLAANVRTAPAGSRLWISPDGGTTWPAEPCFMLWDAAAGVMRGEILKADDIPEKSAENDGVWDALQRLHFGTPTFISCGGREFLLTYWAEHQGITHVRSARMSIEVP